MWRTWSCSHNNSWTITDCNPNTVYLILTPCHMHCWTYAVGTTRTNRKHFPSDLLQGVSRTKRGEFAFRQSGNLLVTAWQDKKTVTIAATMFQPNATTMVQRRRKDGSSMMVPCPESVVMYNQYMGGVDRGDQLRDYYHVRLKCVKNYKYIFWFLFEVAVTNAYILTHYTVATGTIKSQQTFKAFRLRLATQLIGNYKTHLCPGRPHLRLVQGSAQEAATPGHWPRRGTSRQCVYCQQV